MELKNINITQHDLRNIDQIPEMVEFVKGGGIFSANRIEKHGGDKDLIILNHFEDGSFYIHNGYHRATSIWLAGRERLTPDEYYIYNRKYSDYMNPRFFWPDGSWLGWVTPFDPRTENRTADFNRFKERVRLLFVSNGAERAIIYIAAHKPGYATPKLFATVPDLAKFTQPQLPL